MLARLVFSTEDQNGGGIPRVVRISDAKSTCHDIFDTEVNAFYDRGFKVISLRRSSAMTFDNTGQVLQHSVQCLLHSLTVFPLSFAHSYID